MKTAVRATVKQQRTEKEQKDSPFWHTSSLALGYVVQPILS
jgi:hypothetical protein